jgi:methyl-accepting chemotaxis protein
MPIPGPSDLIRWTMRSATTAASVPERVLNLLTTAESVVSRADDLLRRTEELVTRSEAAVAHAEEVTTAAATQVAATEPVIEFVKEFSAHEVQAAIALVDELPRLARHLDNDVLPILTTLNRVGPDIHELLDVAKDVRQAILGIPGFDYLRRRGEGKDPAD